jgi:hypothetical protein
VTVADDLLTLASEAGTRIGQLWADVVAGAIGLPEFLDAASTLTLAERDAAIALVLQDFTLDHLAEVGVLPAVVVPELPESADINRARWVTIARRIIDQGDTDDPGPRLDRLTRSEISRTAQETYAAALDQNTTVTGYRRQMDADACELCQWWSADGRVWPTGHPMPTHKGCSCTPRAVYGRR